MVTKIDNYGLQNMDRDIFGASGDNARDIEAECAEAVIIPLRDIDGAPCITTQGPSPSV